MSFGFAKLAALLPAWWSLNGGNPTTAAEPARVAPLVCVFLQALPRGGAERIIVTLARELTARGVGIELLLMAGQPWDATLLEELPSGVIVTGLAKGSRRATNHAFYPVILASGWLIPRLVRIGLHGVYRVLPSLRAHLRRRRPDAVLATLTKNNLLVLWATMLMRRRPRIVVREASSFSSERAHDTDRLNHLLPCLVGRWYRRATAVVAVSDGVADDLARTTGLPRAQITTVHNGLDLDLVRRRAPERPEHPWLDGASGPPVILAVGRLEPQKDFATLLDAFALLRRLKPARLIVLGEGRERERLQAKARDLGLGGEVDLPGVSLNPYPYMARAALFALSSRWEGFPNVLLEALACGCPVVSTDCLAGPREILENGMFGRLVPVGDATALAEAMAATLDAPPLRRSLVRRAAAFRADTMAEVYLGLLLGPRVPPRV